MTPASIRALIAASDGSDQGEILNQAFDVLLPKPGKIWADHRRSEWSAEYEAWHRLAARFSELSTAPTESALMIAEAVLQGWEVSSSATYAEVRENPPPATYDEQPYELSGLTSGTGPTRALAIIDAVCAAVERKDEE